MKFEKPIPENQLMFSEGHGQDLTQDGKCTGCGECCSNRLPLTRTDIARIQRHIRNNGVKPVEHAGVPFVAGRNGVSEDQACPFLDPSRPNGKKCIIYDVRPAICRYYVCSAESNPTALKEFQDRLLADKSVAREMASMSKKERFRDVRKTFFPDNPSADAGKTLAAAKKDLAAMIADPASVMRASVSMTPHARSWRMGATGMGAGNKPKKRG